MKDKPNYFVIYTIIAFISFPFLLLWFFLKVWGDYAVSKGNQFWKMRETHGRNPIFETPEQLWVAACEYFQWVENNPLLEEKIFHAQGIITKDTVTKMRAMTIRAMCFFMD
jgi:hypothetical protein